MIGNITLLYEQNNYGQRLQCFALQRHVKIVFGEEVATLDFRKPFSYDDGMFFHSFERDRMNIVRPDSEGSRFSLSSFRKVILGGDQVLNFGFSSAKSFVEFITKSGGPCRNVFSYGAGLGQSHRIPSDMVAALGRNVFAYGLREKCIDVCHATTIDPVFLIPREEWASLSMRSKSSFRGEVTYIVKGGMSDELSIIGHDGEREVLISKGKGKNTAPDPMEFVGLFGRADSLKTNSFHGLAFGLIFGVKKIVVEDPSDHRMSSLARMLGFSFCGNAVIGSEDVSIAIKRRVQRADIFLESCLRDEPRKYAAYSKDKSVRDVSTSGGFCAEVARYATGMSGVVYGGGYSDDFTKVVTRKVCSFEDFMSKLSQSKYSFCFLPKLSSVRDEIMSGKTVVFIGSPCQVFALRMFIGNMPENCFLIDFRCNCYSNPRVLRNLVEGSVKKFGAVSNVVFRRGHSIGGIFVEHANGTVERLGRQHYESFLKKNQMEQCKTCRFQHGMVSCSDVTVGDFWDNRRNRIGIGPEFTPERGCNVVCVNTEKGKRLFDSVSDMLVTAVIGPDGSSVSNVPEAVCSDDVTRRAICQAVKLRLNEQI